MLHRRALLTAASLGAVLAGGKRPCSAEEALHPPADIQPIAPPGAPPEIRAVTLDGAQVSLAAVAGRPAVLNVWATWCIPCVRELPELDALAADPGIAVVALSVDRGGAATLGPFLATHRVAHLRVWLDPSLEAAHALGAAAFPTTFVLDAAGRLRGKLEGPGAWSGAADRVRALTR